MQKIKDELKRIEKLIEAKNNLIKKERLELSKFDEQINSYYQSINKIDSELKELQTKKERLTIAIEEYEDIKRKEVI